MNTAGTSSQQRRDPQPMAQGWELAVAAVGGVLSGLGLAALVGLGTASALFGRGWVWPHGTSVIGHVLAGILTGHPGRGLDPTELRNVPARVAVYLCIAVCELAILLAAVAGGVLLARYRGPGDTRRGMATRSEAEAVLGLSTLQSARHIIRPDLTEPPRQHRRLRRTPHAQPVPLSTDPAGVAPTVELLSQR